MYARNFYEYYKYSDLEHFIRINPVSKRCAVSIGNILCEYYTVPRLITDKQPCGYTAYTSHILTTQSTSAIGEILLCSYRIRRNRHLPIGGCLIKSNQSGRCLRIQRRNYQL